MLLTAKGLLFLDGNTWHSAHSFFSKPQASPQRVLNRDKRSNTALTNVVWTPGLADVVSRPATHTASNACSRGPGSQDARRATIHVVSVMLMLSRDYVPGL